MANSGGRDDRYLNEIFHCYNGYIENQQMKHCCLLRDVLNNGEPKQVVSIAGAVLYSHTEKQKQMIWRLTFSMAQIYRNKTFKSSKKACF